MKNLQKGFVVPLLIAVIALLVIGGGIYIYENKKAEIPVVIDTGTQQLNQRQTNTQTPPAVKKTTPIAEKTNNLSLYTNTKYGFTLSIPKEWKVVFSEGRGCCGQTSIARFFIGVNPFLDGMDRGLSVYVYDRKDDKQYEEMKQGNNLALATIHSKDEINKMIENREKCLSEHIKDIKVGENNLSAIEIYDATDDCFSNIYQFVVKGNTYDYIIVPWPTKGTGYVGYDGKLEVSKTLPEFDQILSSFKTTAIPATSTTIEKASGIIRSVYTKSGKNYIDIDYIEWNPNWVPGGGGNGPVYQNANSQIRTFGISPNAKFITGSPATTPATFQDFSNLFISTGIVNGVSLYHYERSNPWDIVITDGVVTQITEHFLP